MLPRQLRVGDLVDDYCPRERRLTDHAIVAMVEDDVRRVRCSACDAEHEYRQGKVPASRKKKAADPVPPPAAAPLSALAAGAIDAEAPAPAARPDAPAQALVAARAAAAPEPPAPAAGPAGEPASAAAAGLPHDGPFHRRLIRATLPRIEGAEVPPRPIPEFTMHKAASAQGHRHGKPYRPGQPGGPHRPGAKGVHGAGRPGGVRHGQGQGQGHADGNTFGNRGNRGGPGGPGGPHGPRPSRHGFSHKTSHGPKKH